LTALAIAYQVQCRLSDVAPVRAKGFDHTTQGSYALAAAISKALRLNTLQTANAIAISGTAFNALRVTRTGTLSHWKGLAYPNTAFGCAHAAFMAMRGITGPLEVFEGNKGFMDVIAGEFEIDWSQENLEKVTETILKKYNAEIHSQSAIEGILELKKDQSLTANEVKAIDLQIFDVAYHIIGGGEEGNKSAVSTKEQADHSLPYLLSVAILDDQVMPEQYRQERIGRKDVQDLLRKIRVRPSEAYSQRFPKEMPCRLTLTLNDGRIFVKEKSDYEGFLTRPMQWETVVKKFEQLSAPCTSPSIRHQMVDAVAHLETIQISELMGLLELR
jgi:2-methylcitrate dehydratase